MYKLESIIHSYVIQKLIRIYYGNKCKGKVAPVFIHHDMEAKFCTLLTTV